MKTAIIAAALMLTACAGCHTATGPQPCVTSVPTIIYKPAIERPFDVEGSNRAVKRFKLSECKAEPKWDGSQEDREVMSFCYGVFRSYTLAKAPQSYWKPEKSNAK